MEERRIVLLGKTGSGKSSLANTILGQKSKFKTSPSSMSLTQECAEGERVIDGKKVRVFDTPGFFDTKQTSSKLNAEILKSLKLCAPGPHAFLLVFKVDRFTTQENDVVKEMLRSFSKDAFNYTTVVFTHGDQLDGMRIEDWARENDILKTLIEKCGGRVHVFDNRYWDDTQDPYKNNEKQVTALLNTINKTVRNNRGKYYTNGFWEWIKSIEVFGLPLHVLLGVILGGIAFSVVGGGVAVANASYVKTISVVSGLCGGVAGGILVVNLDKDFDPGATASNVLRKLGLKENKDKNQ